MRLLNAFTTFYNLGLNFKNSVGVASIATAKKLPDSFTKSSSKFKVHGVLIEYIYIEYKSLR